KYPCPIRAIRDGLSGFSSSLLSADSSKLACPLASLPAALPLRPPWSTLEMEQFQAIFPRRRDSAPWDFRRFPYRIESAFLGWCRSAALADIARSGKRSTTIAANESP